MHPAPHPQKVIRLYKERDLSVILKRDRQGRQTAVPNDDMAA